MGERALYIDIFTGSVDLVNMYGWGKGLYILIYSLVLLI